MSEWVNWRSLWTCQALDVIMGRGSVVLLKKIGGRLAVSGLEVEFIKI